MALNCAQLKTIPNVTGGYDCKTWVEVQPAPLETLAITKEQAYQLTSAIVAIFITAYVYKIVERHFFKPNN